MTTLLYAETPQAAPQRQPEVPFFLHPIPLFVVFMIFFYFMMIRPQNQKAKAQKKMIANLKKGDHILTASGFYAVVSAIGDTSVEIKLADNVKVKILKSAVAEVLSSPDGTGTAAADAKSETAKTK